MLTAILVGGPEDGRIRALPGFMPTLSAAVFKGLGESGDIVLVEVYRYIELSWVPRHLAVYLHESIPQERVVEAILAGYRQPVAQDER
jgi:hypothetical protein